MRQASTLYSLSLPLLYFLAMVNQCHGIGGNKKNKDQWPHAFSEDDAKCHHGLRHNSQLRYSSASVPRLARFLPGFPQVAVKQRFQLLDFLCTFDVRSRLPWRMARRLKGTAQGLLLLHAWFAGWVGFLVANRQYETNDLSSESIDPVLIYPLEIKHSNGKK